MRNTKTDKFTWAFQEFVNTYGVPRYKEINPALFTAATFPFMFGVMYGDIGHGSILALVGKSCVAISANVWVVYGDIGHGSILALVGKSCLAISVNVSGDVWRYRQRLLFHWLVIRCHRHISAVSYCKGNEIFWGEVDDCEEER